MIVPEDIRQLKDEYLSLSQSEENRRRLCLWEREVVARDQWHGRPRLGALGQDGVVPVEVIIQFPFFLPIFEVDLAATYQEPKAYLRFHLQRMIWMFRNVPDDVPLDGVMPIYLSTPFEPSLLGVPFRWFAHQDPTVDQHERAPIQTRQDLECLAPIDFYRSGMMPLALRLYEGVRELVDDDLIVAFPEWQRGPFGVAHYLRGYQDLLADLAADPLFVHALMARIVAERRRWFEERARYLGEPVPAGSILDDEVDAGVIGARHYRDFVLPYEKEIGQYHGRISYWHSCGNTGPIARHVLNIGCVEMLDVSGWTDLEQVLSSIDARGLRIERRFKPVEDLQDAAPHRIEERVRQTVRLACDHGVGGLCLRTSGIQPWSNPCADVEKVRLWLDITRRVVEETLRARRVRSPRQVCSVLSDCRPS
jgi:hypothetical protein